MFSPTLLVSNSSTVVIVNAVDKPSDESKQSISPVVSQVARQVFLLLQRRVEGRGMRKAHLHIQLLSPLPSFGSLLTFQILQFIQIQ
jgi:hypothetical protein